MSPDRAEAASAQKHTTRIRRSAPRRPNPRRSSFAAFPPSNRLKEVKIAARRPITTHGSTVFPGKPGRAVIANEAPTRAARAVGSRPVNARRSPPGEPSQRRNRTGPDHTSRTPRNYRLFGPRHPWGIDPNRVGRSRDPPTHRVRVIARTRIPVGFDVASDAAPPVRSRASARSVAADRPRSPCAAR